MESEIYEKNFPIIEELYRKKRGYYIKVAYNICRDMDLAKEIVSDAFYKILNYNILLKPAYESHTLMVLITQQQLFNRFKRMSLEKRIKQIIEIEVTTESNLDKLSLYPLNIIIAKRVEKLPEKERIIIKSRYYKEMSLIDISKNYNIKLNQIPAICHRVFGKLKRADPTENRTGLHQKRDRVGHPKPPAFAFEILRLRAMNLKHKQIAEILNLDERKVRATYGHYKKKIEQNIIDRETLLTIKN